MNPVDKLLAIEEIKQLKARYFRFLDTKDFTGLATVFAEDAWFDARNSARDGDGPDTLAQMLGDDCFPRGRTAIMAFISGRVGPQNTVHHGHMHEIEILSDSEARGIIAMEDYNRRIENGVEVRSLNGYGHYHETYVKRDGRWQIHTSRITRLRCDISGTRL
jgi:hypothetical protein